MDESVEQVVHDGETFALILRDEYSKPGISFVTAPELSQQLAYMRHPSGKVIEAHFHHPIPRNVKYTLEVLFIKRGRLRVNFFDERHNFIDSRELKRGDVILLVKGGHGFEVLEEVEMIEVKQGPYVGDQDKKLVNTISAKVLRAAKCFANLFAHAHV
jgi:hypothetical protein